MYNAQWLLDQLVSDNQDLCTCEGIIDCIICKAAWEMSAHAFQLTI